MFGHLAQTLDLHTQMFLIIPPIVCLTYPGTVSQHEQNKPLETNGRQP